MSSLVIVVKGAASSEVKAASFSFFVNSSCKFAQGRFNIPEVMNWNWASPAYLKITGIEITDMSAWVLRNGWILSFGIHLQSALLL